MMYLPPPVNIRATAGKKKSMGSSIAQPPMEVREKMGCTVCHRHGYEHVERYDSCGRTCEKSDDEEHGGYNFAH